MQLPSKPIQFQPKQALFDQMYEKSKASWFGYGGSRGGAKSAAARRIMYRRRLTYPNTDGQIIRRVWDDVLKNHVLEMFRDFPELREFYKAQEKRIALPNGSNIFFDSAEVEQDVERKAYGPQFMDIMIDQAEQFTESELKRLKTTCRWPNMPEHACKFALYFNPGGKSAGFLQRVFHLHEYHEREIDDDFTFLQAYGWDNVCWALEALKQDGLSWKDYYQWASPKRFQYYITRTQYGKEMNALDANQRPGQLLGDFKKFAGQYFSNFNPDVHVWNINDIIFQPHWRRWIAVDWGFKHHAVVGWFCQAGLRTEEGTIKPLTILYRMIVRHEMSERALAEEIAAFNGEDKITKVWAGHDLWKEDRPGDTKEKAMSDVLMRHGLPRLIKAKIDRVDGWRHVHTALDEGEFIITDNCKEAILALPMLVYDEKKDNEDILKTKTKEDDIADMIRYGTYSDVAPQEEPELLRIQRQAAHLTDITQRNIFMMKQAADIQNKRNNSGLVNNHSIGRYARYASRWGKRVGRV